MLETTCQFGEKKRLHGILTIPSVKKEQDGNRQQKNVLLLISAGFLSTSGPFRLYTLLARTAADYGITTLRFDLGGLGNSEQIHSDWNLEKRTRHDILQAVNYLSVEHGYDNFTLCGLCSGAEDSFRYAKYDKRVVAVILIDPHCYKTMNYYWREFFSRRMLIKILFKVYQIYKSMSLSRTERVRETKTSHENSLIDYQYMSLEKSKAILSQLMNQGTLIHYIYTGAVLELFNDKKQVVEMFNGVDFNGQVSADYLPDIDHTQILKEDKSVLISHIIKAINSWQAG